MIHHIAEQRYKRPRYKPRCTRKWMQPDMVAEKKGARLRPKDLTSSFTKVTCPQCLLELIRKVESDLEKMKETLNAHL